MAYAVSSGLNGPDKSSGPSTTIATANNGILAASPAAAAATAQSKAPVATSSSAASIAPKPDKRLITPGGRHHRSSSLENNIIMANFNIAPFTGGGGGQNKPQLSIAEPDQRLSASPARSSSSSSSALSSPFNNHRYHPPLVANTAAASPQYHQHPLAAHHHHHHHHSHHSLSSGHQPMSLGHIPNDMQGGGGITGGHKSSFRLGGGGGGGTSLGGQSPLQPYYGTLKSKREQKRMQMSQKMGQQGQMIGGGGGSALQQRISSVDDLRPGSGNSISKSQVRLMREMFEQQQQKQNPQQQHQQHSNRSEGGQMTTKNGSNTNNSLNRKYCEEENRTKHSSLMNLHSGGGGGDDGERDTVDMPLNKPPAIQPCSGVLEMNKQQLIKPIAFKPIPFPADSRFNYEAAAVAANDRYGSTPSLNPPINYNLKFGSTHDLRHNFNTIGSRKAYAYNLQNYDSMESISPDSICSSQSTLKSMNYQGDFLLDTPSPSDSGISELEAALRDRDSELAYLRQTMEHNEKDKERNWEDEIKRMRTIHAQRIQKFEQIAMMQSFQLRQAKKRHQEEATQLRDRIKDVERKAELQHNEIMGHKVNEKELREQCSDMMEENELMRKLINELRSRLEESEWSNCQKNGEAALLKTQLKDAQQEVMNKDQEIAQLRMELKVQAYDQDRLVLPGNDPDESAIIITTHPSVSSSSSPVSINHSDDEKLKDDLQLSHLNRIIILKDQIIMAMTNEIQKLKKEVADQSLLSSYEGLPPGRGTNNGQRKESEQQQQPQSNETTTVTKNNYNKENAILGDYHDLLNNLKNSEDFLKCTSKEKPTLEELKNALLNNQFGNPIQSGREKVAINHLAENCGDCQPKRTNLDSVVGVVKEQENSDEQLAKLKQELEEMKKSFDEERKKWTEEKEKVLVYQRQLQRNYERLHRNGFRESTEAGISI